MIPNDKELKLISIYLYVCKQYETELKYVCQRYSNNSQPKFSDQEIMTIYLFATDQQRYFSIKEIHTFAREYLHSWFPELPSYQQFSDRINKLCGVFQHISLRLLEGFLSEDCDLGISLTDSFPIVTCKGRNRKGRVAPELTDKGYCSTKNLYYYGMKLHALTFKRKGRIPFPEQLLCTSASVNDLDAFKQAWGDTIANRTVFGDKIYLDKNYFDIRHESNNLTMLTPIKLVKGESEEIRKREKAYRDLYSAAVSSVRQPIESFFNWLNEKTSIQRASKVRSAKGLLLHIFGRIAAAFIHLIF
ncbi:MAG: transposase [Rikenellaceae bacterium]